MRPRTVAASALTIASLIAGLLTTAGPAQARPLDLTCTPPSSDVITYDPPLTRDPKPTRVSARTEYGPCVSLSHPRVTSGTRTDRVSGSLSCLELLLPTSTTFRITWNTGQTSTVEASVQSSLEGATLTVVMTGTVTNGLFAGGTFLQTNVGAATDILQCELGEGTVRDIYSTVTLEIT
ncbi:hypothetical protein [Streptomyces violens]|uniref:hypothetical protein n=1 Tax=Streptomyces violens TaxID=66377 RepID=UPI0004C1D685|nr:hypothetical protein [Streptomyces violens]